jgi:signal transduction histidine kinase
MALADAVAVGLLECRHGRTVWANPALARLLGATHAEKLVGLAPDAFVADAGEGLPDWLGGEAAAAEPGRPIKCLLRREGGPPRTVRVRPLGEGRFEIVDVSRICELEAESHRLGAELLAARQEIGALRARAERHAKEREALLSTVSHELQTPLTVMAGFTRLLLAEQVGRLNAEQRHFLEESAKSCRRLSAFIVRLTEAESEAAGGRPVALHEGSLEPILQAVGDLLRPLARERRQRLEIRVDPRAPHARFDSTRIEQVLINLLGNAVKHGRAGGTIEITARPLDAGARRFLEVSVRDDGPGIPEEARERIFEPYVRGGEPGPEGLGLGLAICKRIVEAHGGTIGVDAAPGGGSRFWFTLDAASEAGAR